jgi:hypothetical protein
VQQQLSATLTGALANISLTNGDLVYHITEDDDHPDIGFIESRIAGNCSTRVEGEGGYFELKATKPFAVPISGNMVTEPLVIAGSIPISVKYNQDLRVIGGSAKPGPGCWDWWDDNFDYIGEANAELAVNGVISLEPTVHYSYSTNTSTGFPDATVTVKLKPIVSFRGTFLHEVNFSFREEGRDANFATFLWTAITHGINSAVQGFALPFNGFNGDRYLEVYWEGISVMFYTLAGVDLAVLSENEFVVADEFWALVTDHANDHFGGTAYFEDYFAAAEKTLYADLANNLELDANGEVEYSYSLSDLRDQAVSELIPIIQSLL